MLWALGRGPGAKKKRLFCGVTVSRESGHEESESLLYCQSLKMGVGWMDVGGTDLVWRTRKIRNKEKVQ